MAERELAEGLAVLEAVEERALGVELGELGASFTTESKSSSSRNAPNRARLASSTSGFLGDCERTTWIIRIAWRSSSERVTPASASSRRRVGSAIALVAAPARTCERPKKSLSIDAVLGPRAEVEQVGGRVQRPPPLAEGLADLGVLEVARLDDRPEHQVSPLGFADVPIGPAHDLDLVEGDHQLGAFFAEDLESWTIFRG